MQSPTRQPVRHNPSRVSARRLDVFPASADVACDEPGSLMGWLIGQSEALTVAPPQSARKSPVKAIIYAAFYFSANYLNDSQNQRLMIKVIVFDAGGVLIRFSMKRLARQYAKVLKLDPVLINESWVRCLPDFERGKINVKQFYNNFCSKIGIKPNYSLLNSVFDKHFRLNKSVYKYSQGLRKKYKVGLLSNADPRFHRIIDKLLGKNYDFDIISHKVGFIKPEKEIYEYLIRRANCKPEEMVFIDDYHSFAEGAQRADINAIVFKSLTQLKRDLRRLGIS